MHSDTQLVILAGRGVNDPLRRWAARFDHCRLFAGSSLPDHLACRRNRIFQWFRDECRPALAWLLMIDDDMVPVPGTEDLLACPADVACARAFARTGREAHRHGLSVACLKVSRAAVAAIRPPWFRFAYSPDGTRATGCECGHFWRRAVRAGFRPVQAGIVGHRFPVTVLPGPTFLFDADLFGAHHDANVQG